MSPSVHGGAASHEPKQPPSWKDSCVNVLSKCPSCILSFRVILKTEHGHGHKHVYHFNLLSVSFITLAEHAKECDGLLH